MTLHTVYVLAAKSGMFSTITFDCLGLQSLVVACHHQYENISSDEVFCYADKGSHYDPPKVRLAPLNTPSFADFNFQNTMNSSESECSTKK